MQTIIITGAAGNVGRAVVNQFLQKNYKVIAVTDPAHNDSFDVNENLQQYRVNVSDEAASQRFIDSLETGSIDVAVLTVGGFAMGSIATTPAAAIAQQYKLNFETAYNIARPVFARMMEQKRGRIFLIGARPALNAAYGKGMTAYSLAKSLIFRLAELMNEEAKGTEVVTAVVVPSTIDTVQNRKAMPDADFSKWVQPEDIASVIYFHCSDAAGAIREPVIKIYGNS